MIETLTIVRKQDNYTPDIPHPDICPECKTRDVFKFYDKKQKCWRLKCRKCWKSFD